MIDRAALRQQILTATDLDGLRRALVAVLDTQDPAAAEILREHAADFVPTDQVARELADSAMDRMAGQGWDVPPVGGSFGRDLSTALMDSFPVTEA